jgi:hypothetical protein
MKGYGLLLKYSDGTVGYVGKTEIMTSSSMCWVTQSDTEFNLVLAFAVDQLLKTGAITIELFGPILS